MKSAFSEEMKQAGADLTSLLAQARFPITASFWWRDPELERWNLIIASSSVALEGPRKVYGRLRAILSKQAGALDLSSITVVPPSNPLVSSFRAAEHSGWNLDNVRLSSSIVGDLFVHDAYVYMIK